MLFGYIYYHTDKNPFSEPNNFSEKFGKISEIQILIRRKEVIHKRKILQYKLKRRWKT